MTLRRMVYVVDGFPQVTHTFIAGEIAEVCRRGVDVRILSLRPGDLDVVHPVVRDNGLVERTEYDPARFASALAEHRPQLIHAHFARRATAAARDLAADLGVPYTFTAHGYDVNRRPPDDMAARAAAAAAVVTVSQANADRLTGPLGVDPAKIRVIPCGIDVTAFRPAPAGDAGGDPPLVVAVARLHPVKNLPLLLEACERVARSGIAFRVAVVGEGDERESLERLRDDLGLAEVLRFVGHATQDEVAGWWRRADVGALSSVSEGMPIALMEAAASGVPVVATRVGGVGEMIVEGVTGRAVQPDDPDAFAAALRDLLSDPDLRARMGQAARAHAAARFSVAVQVDRLMNVWSAAVATAAPLP